MATRDANGRFAAATATDDRAAEPMTPAVAAPTPAQIKGGRLTSETSDFAFGGPWVLVPPPTAQQSWDLARVDDLAFGRYRPEQVVDLMIDLSPDTSRGLWDYLRLTNPDWEAVAVELGGDQPLPSAQAKLDDFFSVLSDRYGTPDLVWTRLFCGMFLRGAIFCELVLDEAGRLPLDIAVPDPATARFFRTKDPVLGTQWQLAQIQPGKGPVPLDRPTIRYVPIDPVPGSPYGRSVVAPALFSSVFLLLILHDLRRVVAQQGWPRHDVTVDVSKLKTQMPADKQIKPDAVRSWTEATVKAVQDAYYALQPDQAFVHTEAVTVNKPTGAVDDSSLGAIDPLMRGLERMITRGIKSMPFLMGLSESTTESQALRQYEAWSSAIANQQKLLETTVSRLLQMGLRAQGVQADVKFKFGQVRGSEAQRDAQTLMLKLQNAEKAYYLGFWSMEQASQYSVGMPPDQEEPRFIPVAEQPEPDTVGKVADGAAENPDDARANAVQARQNGRHGTHSHKRASDTGKLTDAEKAKIPDVWDEIYPGKYRGLLKATVVK